VVFLVCVHLVILSCALNLNFASIEIFFGSPTVNKQIVIVFSVEIPYVFCVIRKNIKFWTRAHVVSGEG
jgi:hypothetical protein